jgi:hypothetical protein
MENKFTPPLELSPITPSLSECLHFLTNAKSEYFEHQLIKHIEKDLDNIREILWHSRKQSFKIEPVFSHPELDAFITKTPTVGSPLWDRIKFKLESERGYLYYSVSKTNY